MDLKNIEKTIRCEGIIIKQSSDIEPDVIDIFWEKNSLNTASANDPISSVELKIILLSKLLQIVSIFLIVFNSYYFLYFHKILIFFHIITFFDFVGIIILRQFHLRGILIYWILSIAVNILLPIILGITLFSSENDLIKYFGLFNLNSDCFKYYHDSSSQLYCLKNSYTCESFVEYDNIKTYRLIFLDCFSKFVLSVFKPCFTFNTIVFICLRSLHIILIFIFLKSLRGISAEDIKRISDYSKTISIFI